MRVAHNLLLKQRLQVHVFLILSLLYYKPALDALLNPLSAIHDADDGLIKQSLQLLSYRPLPNLKTSYAFMFSKEDASPFCITAKNHPSHTNGFLKGYARQAFAFSKAS